LKLKYFRGFENPLPRTESPGLAQFDESPALSKQRVFPQSVKSCPDNKA
jgi:hypothetical protein